MEFPQQKGVVDPNIGFGVQDIWMEYLGKRHNPIAAYIQITTCERHKRSTTSAMATLLVKNTYGYRYPESYNVGSDQLIVIPRTVSGRFRSQLPVSAIAFRASIR